MTQNSEHYPLSSVSTVGGQDHSGLFATCCICKAGSINFGKSHQGCGTNSGERSPGD